MEAETADLHIRLCRADIATSAAVVASSSSVEDHQRARYEIKSDLTQPFVRLMAILRIILVLGLFSGTST